MEEKDTQEGMDSGDFLSPEDSEALLASLESDDARLLGRKPDRSEPEAGTPDEGAFIYPGQDEPGSPSAPPFIAQRNDNPHTELLSRIAREVHTIKAELGALAPLRTAESQGSHPGELAPETRGGSAQEAETTPGRRALSDEAWDETKRLLSYLDRLLESLPEEKVDEFVHSEYFDLYRKVFDLFGLT
ncbi:MAG TPA: hypothetical protein VIO60_03395 [Rectinemataceae bacterium]